MHRDMGIDAYRIPLSGSAQNFKGDIRIANTFTAEVKARKKERNGYIRGMETIMKMLGTHDLLFVWPKGDRDCFVLMPGKIYKELIKAYCKYHKVGLEIKYSTPTAPNEYQNEYYGGIKRCED